ncbi:hypothetical protein [Myxosarcina sp. GI1(2024)]
MLVSNTAAKSTNAFYFHYNTDLRYGGSSFNVSFKLEYGDKNYCNGRLIEVEELL